MKSVWSDETGRMIYILVNKISYCVPLTSLS